MMRRCAAAIVIVGAMGVAPSAAWATLRTTPDSTYQTNGRVDAIVTVGSTVYIGGSFTSVRPAGAPLGTGEVPRPYLAAIDALTGQVLPWHPKASAKVFSLAVSPDGSTIYVGGGFGTIAGATRHRFAALSADPNAPVVNQSGWGDMKVDKTVESIAATQSSVYIGGKFLNVSGQPRQHLAAFDVPAGGAAAALDTAWAPTVQDPINDSKYPTAEVFSLVVDASRIFVGGAFSSINNWSGHKNLDAVDLTTGQTSLFKTHPGFEVFSVIPTSTRVYLGGDGAGGTVAGVDAASQSLTNTNSWVMKTDGGVQAIALIGETLYVGGHFDNVCDQISSSGPPYTCTTSMAVRHKIFAMPATGGAIDPWYPAANSNLGLYAMAVETDATSSSPRLEIGGDFTKTGNPGSLGAARYNQQGFAQYSQL